jgi:hypothetical protein
MACVPLADVLIEVVIRATFSSNDRTKLETTVKVIKIQSKIVSELAVSLTYSSVGGER